jgi:hypothetical protein
MQQSVKAVPLEVKDVQNKDGNSCKRLLLTTERASEHGLPGLRLSSKLRIVLLREPALLHELHYQ